MIIPPREWHRSAGVHRLVLEPREAGGRIVYQDRLPVRGFAEIVRSVLANDTRFVLGSRRSIERLVTEEGEHAAWTEIEGTLLGLPLRWFIGAVYTDDFVAVIDGLPMQRDAIPVIGAMTRRLLVEATFGLGARRRRYVYVPPAGWTGLPNGLTASWYPRGFPKHAARIVVGPAAPSTESALVELERLVSDDTEDFQFSGPMMTMTITSKTGLIGARCSYAGADRAGACRSFDVAVFADGRYVYPCWLEAAAGIESDASVFEAMYMSIEPIPMAGGRLGGWSIVHDALSSWSD